MDSIVTRPDVQSSHRVTTRGDRVVLHGVELFCGYDPEIDDPSDERVRAWDRRRVRAAVDRTKQFMARGQRPKLVVCHDSKGDAAPPEAVGDVVELWAETRHGVEYVMGDIEMASVDFEALVKSNRYPRRSAEIWPDGHISEIALLGRETPGRPVHDTKFAKAGTPERWERSMRPERFEMHPGATNVFIPAHGNKDDDMDDSMDRDDRLRELEQENARLRKQIEMMQGANDEEDEYANPDGEPDVEIDVDVDPEDEAVGDGEDEMGKGKYRKRGRKDLFAQIRRLQRDRDELGKIVEDLSTDLAKERFSREIDAMAAEGYAVGEYRAAMVSELVESKNPRAKVAFWKATMRKNPVNKYVDQQAVVAGSTLPSASALDAARARAKQRAVNEGADKFARILQEEIAAI